MVLIKNEFYISDFILMQKLYYDKLSTFQMILKLLMIVTQRKFLESLGRNPKS
jgi:hypothetical protein